MLDSNMGEAHDIEYFDITQKSDMKCERCFEEDAELALYEICLETTPDDDPKDGECLPRARK